MDTDKISEIIYEIKRISENLDKLNDKVNDIDKRLCWLEGYFTVNKWGFSKKGC